MTRSIFWIGLVALALGGCDVARQGYSVQAATAVVSVTPYPALETTQVARGREVYTQSCASCHGPKAEGAPNWATPGPDGLGLAPPHDDTSHTWHHSDRVLYEMIRDGMSDPLRPGSPLRMPAFGGTLSDSDIRAVIEYFKSLWVAENRQYQWDQTREDFAPTPTPPQ